ncbi:MAG: transcriptional regulator [Pyrinomonadaceae bacterium]
MNEPQPRNYEFGDFRIDTAKRRLLRRDGAPLPLTPKVFDTLLYLVRHPGKVLEKDELMREIWPDAVVEENNLNQNVSTLRRVLGESRGENRYVVTVPGRGFRFAAEVRAGVSEDDEESADHVQTENKVEQEMMLSDGVTWTDQHKVGRRSKLWLAVFVGVIVAALGAGTFTFGTCGRQRPPLSLSGQLRCCPSSLWCRRAGTKRWNWGWPTP